jgi:hypothetical protein
MSQRSKAGRLTSTSARGRKSSTRGCWPDTGDTRQAPPQGDLGAVEPLIDLDRVHQFSHQQEAVAARTTSPLLPRAVVPNGEREDTVDDHPADVDQIHRWILRMLDRVHERFRGGHHDGEDLVRRRTMLAEPAPEATSQPGGKLGSCLEAKI